MLFDLSRLEVRRGRKQFLSSAWHDVAQLWCDDWLFVDDLEAADWAHEAVQVRICGCRQPGCQAGSYVCLRRAADNVVILPAFGLWDNEFDQDDKSHVLFPGDRIGGVLPARSWDMAVAHFTASIPRANELPKLRCGDGLAAWWLQGQITLGLISPVLNPATMARLAALSAGQIPEDFAAFDTARVLACSNGDCQAASAALYDEACRFLAQADDACEIVTDTQGPELTIFADGPTVNAWSALIEFSGRNALYLDAGLGIATPQTG